jgi:uncharacterized protein (TIRG00374 family)
MQGVESWGHMTKLSGKVPRRILSILGILIFGAILYYGGIEALRQVAQANLIYLGCAFVAAGSAAFVTSVRWGLIVNSLEGRVIHSKLHYFYYVMMGKISSLLVSQYVGDYGVRPLALKASGTTTLGRAFYSVLVDRLFDLILSLLFLVPTLLYLIKIISSEVMMLLILVLMGIYWVISARNYRILTNSFAAVIRAIDRRKTLVPLMEDVIGRLIEMMEGARKGLEEVGQRCITSANLLTFGRYVAMALRAYFISLALNLAIPFWVIFLAVGLVRFSLLFAVAPGRLGVLEVGWYGMLALAGMESSTIIPFLIGLRVYGFLFNAVLALFTHIAVVVLSQKTG